MGRTMTSREPVYGVGDATPVDYFEKEDLRQTKHGSQKIKNAFRTIKENYDQINHDDEREKIEEAIGTIESCLNHNLEQVMDEVYPNSRVMHVLEEGSLMTVDVQEEAYAPATGKARRVNVQMEVMLPLEE